jgi:hypothetical protein
MNRSLASRDNAPLRRASVCYDGIDKHLRVHDLPRQGSGDRHYFLLLWIIDAVFVEDRHNIVDYSQEFRLLTGSSASGPSCRVATSARTACQRGDECRAMGAAGDYSVCLPPVECFGRQIGV